MFGAESLKRLISFDKSAPEPVAGKFFRTPRAAVPPPLNASSGSLNPGNTLSSPGDGEGSQRNLCPLVALAVHRPVPRVFEFWRDAYGCVHSLSLPDSESRPPHWCRTVSPQPHRPPGLGDCTQPGIGLPVATPGSPRLNTIGCPTAVPSSDWNTASGHSPTNQTLNLIAAFRNLAARWRKLFSYLFSNRGASHSEIPPPKGSSPRIPRPAHNP
jgi:hypothetical protein